MNAKSIYDKLVNVEGVPSSILTYSDKGDCIIIEIQDYNKSVFKFAKEFFKGYKSTDIIYTNENKTAIWYNEVSVYSDRETIQAITDFYYQAKVKGLVESKKSARKSIKESENFVNYIAVYDEDGDCCGYVQNESPRLTQDVEKALHFKDENEANAFRAKLIKRGSFNGDELYIEGMYLNESKNSARKSIKESNRTKLDIIKDMIDLAYDVKQQSKMDKDSYFGNQPNSVINAKDDKVYEKFVDLAEKLKLHGWNQYVDYAYDLINEYENVIEESKKSARKSIKESKTNYLTVEEFCNLCAKIYIHYEIWSFDGHNRYEESYDLSKIKYSPYKNHDVLMWDFDKDVLILYIEDNAIPF